MLSKNDSEQAPERKPLTDTNDVMQKFATAHPNQENVDKYYDDIDSDTYDAFLIKVNFTDPYKLAPAIARPEPKQEVDARTGKRDFGFLNMPRDAKIFDIGQGTGILGRLLNEEGFTNIDGADASQSYVDKANKTGWYRKCQLIWFGKGVDNLPKEMLGQYDLVMASGVFMDGHIPPSGFDDAHALVKPGGYFITSMRRCYYEPGEEHGYREKLDELEAAGKFKIVKTWEFMRGVKGAEDPIFEEMPSFMFVAKRLR